MDVWIARDENGQLFMYFNEPIIDYTSGIHWQSFPYKHMVNIDSTPIAEKLKDLKYTDKPVKAKLKL